MPKGKSKATRSTKSGEPPRKPASGKKPSPSLRVERSGDSWSLLHGSDQVTTTGGKPIRHPARAMLIAMLRQLEERGGICIEGTEIVEPKFVGFHAVFSIEQDWVVEGKDDLTLDFKGHLASDRVLRDVPGPERVYQLSLYQPVYDCFDDVIGDLRALADELDQGDWRPGFRPERVLDKHAKSIESVRALHASLPSPAKAVVMLLLAIHDSQVLAPLALVRGLCSIDEYVDAVVASQCMIHEVFGDVSRRAEKALRDQVRTDAIVLMQYLQMVGAHSAVHGRPAS